MDIDRSERRVGRADIGTPAIRGRLNAIAHEVNNLLTVINGYSELLLKQLDEGDVREQVLEIRQAGARVSELNEELLSIVRPPAPQASAPLPPPASPFLVDPFQPGALPSVVPGALSRQAIHASILVVDDEEGVRKLLGDVLRAAGYEVLTASDGRAAQEVLDARDVDLVLMDVVMPNREGIETISSLRRVRPNLKIVAMSGFGGTFLNVATRLGARAALAKPIGPDTLLSVVAEILVAD